MHSLESISDRHLLIAKSPTYIAMVNAVAWHTLCIRHFFDDLQQHRRQYQICVIHPGRGDLSRPEPKEELAKKFSIYDTQTIFISSFHTTDSFSKGFGIIYDSVKDALQHEPKHRLSQMVLKLMLTSLLKRVQVERNKFMVLKA